MTKYIFVTGGVLSSLGKGLTSAAIGALLESMGHTISFLKLDPYLNVDPGTMSPYEHGEVFVTQDGTESDLDLGHYERFTHAVLTQHNSVTSGKLYARIIEKERRGDYLGGTIQIVPHLTDEIKATIQRVGKDVDFVLVEIGGTVGDIEGLPFIEAIRQMGLHAGRAHCIYLHLTYVPYLESSQEFKTKPTQHAVKELRSLGIQPDILICRSQHELPTDIKKKIALFTNVEERCVLSAHDLTSVYQLPLLLAQERLPEILAEYLHFSYKEPQLQVWNNITETLANLTQSITIAVIGKYIGLKDAYKSLYEALIHAQVPTRTRIIIKWINAEDLTYDNVAQYLQDVQGVIVPGGFGQRGIDGKIIAVHYARLQQIPFLGICLGMQIAVIEFARHVLGMVNAHSTEIEPAAEQPVVDLMAHQKALTYKGGTMRLGAQICTLAEGSKAQALYNKSQISERHRHRYEFNPSYVSAYQQAGFLVTGIHATSNLPEIIELQDHPYFIGCQFHPELQSKPFAPHQLFVSLIEAAIDLRKQI